ISGAHLLFLERLWKKIPLLPSRIKNGSLYLILILYAMAAQLHPPVLRALFAFCLFRFSNSKKLFLNSQIVTHVSGILCLIYKPSWIHSFSLQLSWIASLLQNNKNSLFKAFLTYFAILPIINRWQELHPLTLIINWILAPVIGAVLFPLSFLSLFFKPLHLVTDQLWSLIFTLLQITHFFPEPISFLNWSLPEESIFLYMGLVIFLVYIMNTYKRFSLYKKKSQKLHVIDCRTTRWDKNIF
ncbi:MAG: ComEC/Rec2 family competence protein, partial [Bdellovibrionales bacterium]